MNWVKPSLARVGQIVFGGLFLAFVLWFLLFIASAIKQDYQRQQVLDEMQHDLQIMQCQNAEHMALTIEELKRSDWYDNIKARCAARVEYNNSFRVKLVEFWDMTKSMFIFLFS